MKIINVTLKKYKRLYLNEIETIVYTPTSNFQLIVGRNGCGKAQPLHSKILTPHGWVTMNDIKINDVVSTPDGKSAVVIGVYPQGIRKVYEINTINNRCTEADYEHLWVVYINGGWIRLETKDILDNLLMGIDVYLPIYINGNVMLELVDSVIELGNQEVKCIMIDSKDHLYITDNYIVTHNTSLLNAIFNQPADKNDYDKGGYNEVRLEHNRYEYILINDFTSNPKYYFQRKLINSDDDFEELNNSRLISTQKELVYKHFGLTSDIVELLLDVVNFTNMSVNKRRDWFNIMHKSDLTYINQLYTIIKSKHRDAMGTIKNIGNKLIIEKNNQITKTEYDEIIKRKDYLSDRNHELAKAFNQECIDNYDQNKLINLTNSLVNIRHKVEPYFKKNIIDYKDLSTSIDDTKSYLIKLSTRKEELEKQLILTKKKFDKMNIDKIEYNQYSSTQSLMITESQYITDIKNIIDNIDNNYQDFKIYKYNSTYITDDTIDDALTKLLLSLPQQDDDLTLLNVNYTDILNTRKTLSNIAENLNFNHDKLIEKKKHITLHLNDNLITCPKCNNVFNKKLDIENLEQINIKIDNIVTELSVVNKQIADNNELIDRYIIYKDRFNLTKPLVDTFDIGEIVTKLVSLRTYNNRSTFLIKYFDVYKLQITLRKLNTELTLIQEQIKLRQNKGEDYYLKIEDNIDIVENELRQQQDTIIDLDNEIKIINDKLKIKELLINNVLLKIPTVMKDIDNALIEEYNYNKNILLKELWENTLQELQIIYKKYNDYNIKDNLINDYEKIIADENKKMKNYAILMDELSPQGGLIAEQATSFINIFINNLNLIIRKIFNYDLIVEPCDLSEGDLTYRFKVTGGNQIRNDISNTSEGQKEVINLAFKLLVYHYCHLDAIPFINDELGKNFDEYHKQASVNYLRDLLINDKFGQFFLISHHATSYTSLIDAEVVVLDPNNVVLPEKYNTGLIINNK